MKVTPKIVSTLVVKIVISFSLPSVNVLNTTSVPQERPIQFLCISLRESVQSRDSRLSRSLPA